MNTQIHIENATLRTINHNLKSAINSVKLQNIKEKEELSKVISKLEYEKMILSEKFESDSQRFLKQINEKDHKIEDLQRKLADAKVKLESEIHKNNQQELYSKKLDEHLSVLPTSEEANQMRQNISQCNRQIERLTQENASYRSQIGQLTRELSAVQSNAAQKEECQEILQQRLDWMTQKFNQLQKIQNFNGHSKKRTEQPQITIDAIGQMKSEIELYRKGFQETKELLKATESERETVFSRQLRQIGELKIQLETEQDAVRILTDKHSHSEANSKKLLEQLRKKTEENQRLTGELLEHKNYLIDYDNGKAKERLNRNSELSEESLPELPENRFGTIAHLIVSCSLEIIQMVDVLQKLQRGEYIDVSELIDEHAKRSDNTQEMNENAAIKSSLMQPTDYIGQLEEACRSLKPIRNSIIDICAQRFAEDSIDDLGDHENQISEGVDYNSRTQQCPVQ